MIIPSIDIQSGQAVQLIGGRDKALDGGDPLAVAERFAVAGELAVIDLDAAMGKGDNDAVIRELVRRYPCRVGGGIRSVERALQWLDAGAEKVILGTAARPELLSQLPRERVIAALDAVSGEIVVEGWRTRTGQRVEDRIGELVPFCGGFLLTFVELEGRLGGTDLERARALVEQAGDARVTIAGGVTTAEEIAALDALGADAQVGMALYTGQLSLGDAVAAVLTSDRPDGFWPTVVCDESGRALGLAYSDAESLRRAIDERRGIYRSRRRGLWIKGETSGDTQDLLAVDVDCDRDTLRFIVRQHGAGFCHQPGCTSCFGATSTRGADGGFAELERRLRERKTQLGDSESRSYTARLLREPALLGAKLREEASELAEASEPAHVAAEAADLLYFAASALRRADVDFHEVERELTRRQKRVQRRNEVEPGAGEAKVALATAPAATAAATASKTSGAQPLLRRCRSDELSAAMHEPLDAATRTRAEELFNAVSRGGEAALRRISRELGDLDSDDAPLWVDRRELEAARDALPSAERELLERCAARVRAFAEAQRATFSDLELALPGGAAGHALAPVERAGCYAPGGRFPLPSTVLMTVIPARVAGVREVFVASPRPTNHTLAAAAIAGADGLLAVGGAQAIAALCEGIAVPARSDVIVGPGNRFVTAAKQLVAGRVGIDMLAGPTELLVLASAGADARLIAADLLAQAEHDSDARPILVSLDAALIDAVERELVAQLASLPTAETARAALSQNGLALRVSSAEEAIAVCDRLGAEHLQLSGDEAVALAPRLSCYGALFIGEGSAEVLGDYCAGPNHTLPTGGTARHRGGLSVFDFLRVRTWLRIDDRQAAGDLYADAAALGAMEGLIGHQRAAERRRDRS